MSWISESLGKIIRFPNIVCNHRSPGYDAKEASVGVEGGRGKWPVTRRVSAADLIAAPRGCSEIHSGAAGLQQIGPRQQRRNHPVGKDKTAPMRIRRVWELRGVEDGAGFFAEPRARRYGTSLSVNEQRS
jgi:hypothetical protein